MAARLSFAREIRVDEVAVACGAKAWEVAAVDDLRGAIVELFHRRYIVFAVGMVVLAFGMAGTSEKPRRLSAHSKRFAE